MIKNLVLRKELKHLYAPLPKQVEILRVPKFRFVMTDGQIEPGETPETSPAFHDPWRHCMAYPSR